jgi:hypothetical protein
MVNLAPRGPKERDPPDLLRFRVTPGAILIRLQKRKAMIHLPSPPLEFEAGVLYQWKCHM